MRNCFIGMQDGFSGTGVIDDSSIMAGDTTLLLDEDLFDLHDDATIVPVGARFTTAGITTVRQITAVNSNCQFQVTIGADTMGTYTVTVNGVTSAAINGTDNAAAIQAALEAMSNIAPGDVVVTGSGPYVIEFTGAFEDEAVTVSATPTGLDNFATSTLHEGGKSWRLTFTPAIASGSVPADEDVVTFLPVRIIAKVGSGDFSATRNNEWIFDTDRDQLDGVRQGADVPMDVEFGFVYNWLISTTGEPVTLYEALYREGAAAGWHNAALDPCEPYCPDIFLIDIPKCGSSPAEVHYYRRFYPDNSKTSIRNATVELVGKCNANKPEITREVVDRAAILLEFGLTES